MSFFKNLFTYFKTQESQVRPVYPGWTVAQLLNQQGLFALKEVGPRLGLENSYVARLVDEACLRGEDPWISLGLRQSYEGWFICMPRFAPIYRAQLTLPAQEVLPEWDANQLLACKGVFLLSQVVAKIPFTEAQIRYQIQTTAGAREQCGVWRDPKRQVYLVDMEAFGPWITAVWRGEAPSQKPGPSWFASTFLNSGKERPYD